MRSIVVGPSVSIGLEDRGGVVRSMILVAQARPSALSISTLSEGCQASSVADEGIPRNCYRSVRRIECSRIRFSLDRPHQLHTIQHSNEG